MLQAAKTLERMVNQNIFDDISQGRYPRYSIRNIYLRIHIFPIIIRL